MRLVLLIPTLDRSGAEKQFALLACGLKRKTDWDVRAVALTRGGPYEKELKEAGIPLRILNKRAKFDPLALLRLRQLLREWSPDILHTWLFAANAYGRMAAGRRPKCRVVVSERCVDSWKSGWQLKLDRRFIPRTDKLLTNSNAVRDFYLSVGYPAERIGVIPNAVAIPQRDEKVRSRLRSEWNVPQDARVVGYVGRLARQKRIKDLIWGFQQFRQLTDNVHFVIAGDGPERADLESYAYQMNCDHLIHFVGHREEGTALMNAFDLFWLGSDFEGMSNSLMEAMAAGLPCVASDIPPNRELVVNGETGELYPVGDTVALAQFSDRIINDAEMFSTMSGNARERMATEFGIDAMIDRHIACYQSLLESAGC